MCSEKNMGWYFPTNLGGQEEDFENQGINHFMMSPCGKLAREIIQNSYDARINKENNRVRVEFRLLKLPKTKIPNFDNIQERIEASAEYFPDSPRLQKFKNTAKKVFNEEYIDVLKISDYNTTGLVGIGERKNSSWYGLIKSSGHSTKSGKTGGSYGSGKHAAFVFSYFRTIMYGTYVEKEGYAFQGKSILCSHKINDELKSNVGYYGIIEENECKPIRKAEDVDEIFRRDRTGTDLYIVGAKLEDANWEKNILYSVIENFWKLIINDKLEVVIAKEEDEILVDSKNVRQLAQLGKEAKVKIDDKSFNAYKFIELYDDNNAKVVYGSICEKNDVELKIAKMLEYPEKNILKMRDTEMKIRIWSPKKRPVNFIGILTATGDELNRQLRESEPQTHDDWNADNIADVEDRKIVKQTINRLNDWINQQINDLEYIDNEKQFDADGLDFLNVEDYDEPAITDFQKPFDYIENEEKSEVEIMVVKKPDKKIILDANEDDGDVVGGPGEGNEPSVGPGPDPNPDPNPNPNPNPNPKPGKAYREISMEIVKTPYDEKSQMYRIILKSEKDIENCSISIQRVTDSGELEKLKVEKAVQFEKELDIVGNIIKNVKLIGNSNNFIYIRLQNNRKCIMEVKVYVQD